MNSLMQAQLIHVFHKGDCPARAFDDWCHLCEVRPSAEEATKIL